LADNFNTQIAELLLRHDIDLTKLDAGNARRIRELFRSMGKEVADKVLSIDPTEPPTVAVRNKRLDQVIAVGSETIEEGFVEIQDVTGEEAKDLAQLEAATVAESINKTVNVSLASGRLNQNVLKRLADNTLIQGAPSRDWWKDQDEGLRESFKREMREGVVQGESIQDLVRRIRGRREHGFKDGLISHNSSASRRAQALARTSVLAVANAARMETFIQNDNVVKGVSWLSTLDTRTSDICKALDGQAWTLKGRRLPGTTAPWRGPPPAHWNCRSTIVSVLKPWSDLITDPEIKKKMLRAEARNDLPKGWRAAMDGKVSGDLKYGDWLRKQSKATQIEVLGPKKWKLWDAGKLKMTDLIDQSHQPFTLKDLTDKLARERK